jgi:two-component system sensor histidine kinase KdpD
LLVWVGNNAQAELLVRHAARLADAEGLPWTVVCVGSGLPDVEPRSAAAMKLAEALGAATATIMAGDPVSAIAEKARSERASMLLIGGHAPEGWLEGLPRPWLGHLAEALSTRLPDVTVDVVYFPGAEAPRRERVPPSAAPTPALLRSDWLFAAAVVALCTAISETLLEYLELASVAVIYLAGVVYVALRQGKSAAMVAVVLSILVFDLLVVLPRWSFKPTDPQYYFTFVVMAIVGWLVSGLADRARQQSLVAQRRAARAQAMNELASRLVSALAEVEIGQALSAAARATFGAASALLLPDAQRALVDPDGFCTADELALARQAMAEGRLLEAGPGVLLAPLHGLEGSVGVLVVRLPHGRAGTAEDRGLLQAFADQAALALQRSLFEHRSATAAVDAEAERLRNTVLSGISHDFRTPLTTIVGSAATLLEQHEALAAQERTALLHDILDEARRMHAAMSDLLDLTRMEEGAMQVRNEWCPADDLVEEARAVCGARLMGRALRVDVPADAIVWCDPRLLQQALVNLVDNAVQHTPPECSIDIRVELARGAWRLVVSDDGPGLPGGLGRDAFKKFVRARGEPSTGGTGLGLAICAAVARLHGGTIDVRNDGGARFTLTLPQPAAGAAPQEALP